MSIEIDLSGSVALVTGISDGGLGVGIATRLAQAGADVALAYRSAEQAATELAQRLSAGAAAGDGPVARAYQAELTDQDRVSTLFDRILSEFGRLDIVINNAGVQPVAKLLDMSVDDWRSVIDANTTSTFLCTRAAAERMPDGGSITHIASIEGHRMARGHAHYSSSKAAVLMHAKAAAVELADRGIRVNTVSPGLIERPGLRRAWPDGVARWEATAPLQRLGSATDVGDACVFLASSLASWITGADLVVDGGVSACPTW
ncbi:MAG: SDR family NAD(P)-dependent oxidoreductase [Acidimicrobiales bacterium]